MARFEPILAESEMPRTRSVFNNSFSELVGHRDSSTKVKPCGSGSSLDRCWSSVTHSWTVSSRSADYGSGIEDPPAPPANEGKRSDGGRLSQSTVNALLRTFLGRPSAGGQYG
ncbi:hypothetical protein TNCT_265741 [Trichonephila clavata]|uniref:Uncharacterized protein n=1 Tax=Trichonephila clavata TaxID=2740835 RepID=A0A8X6I5U5_TRICU|nr:hypothetical protein TNCT_265741 [Trichonephila clavata]